MMGARAHPQPVHQRLPAHRSEQRIDMLGDRPVDAEQRDPSRQRRRQFHIGAGSPERGVAAPGQAIMEDDEIADFLVRSEEHTSELQSLMRISYAVFCLKKKKHKIKKKETATQK